MSASASLNLDTQSEASTALSNAPATAVLDQLDVELFGANPDLDDDRSSTIPPRPRTHKNHTYIEIKIDRKRNTAWFWQHGKEWERQTPRTMPNGCEKKEIYWICSHCISFKPLHRANSTNITGHFRSVHSIERIELFPLFQLCSKCNATRLHDLIVLNYPISIIESSQSINSKQL